MERIFDPYKFSWFAPPISPFRDNMGCFREATTTPSQTVHLRDVAHLIRTDEALKYQTARVRAAKDADALRRAKAHWLAYVTPVGVFKHRRSESIVSYSGLLPIDIDKTGDDLDLEDAKRWIFEGNAPYVKLAFISPSGRGIKLLVDVGERAMEWDESLREEFFNAVNLGVSMDFTDDLKVMDTVGKDLARACFLCHDANVLYRE